MSTPELTVRSVIDQVVAALAPDQTATVSPSSDLRNDLGFYSLAFVELAFLLEDAFDLPPITREDAEEVRRVEDIHAYIERVCAARGYELEDVARANAVLDELESWRGEL